MTLKHIQPVFAHIHANDDVIGFRCHDPSVVFQQHAGDSPCATLPNVGRAKASLATLHHVSMQVRPNVTLGSSHRSSPPLDETFHRLKSGTASTFPLLHGAQDDSGIFTGVLDD
ncbi:MAG TPA: hypothetical protein VNQ32_07765 [Steroidobacteraceae bacterium]|nr:hypothetical protein [Steroidobacteraceae bacterium]